VVSVALLPLYTRGSNSHDPLDRHQGGPQSLSGRAEWQKSLLGNWSPVVHLVAIHFPDWAIPEILHWKSQVLTAVCSRFRVVLPGFGGLIYLHFIDVQVSSFRAKCLLRTGHITLFIDLVMLYSFHSKHFYVYLMKYKVKLFVTTECYRSVNSVISFKITNLYLR
jgi:hypothetical protein